VLTDLKADAEILPIEPMNEEWLAHRVCSTRPLTCLFYYYTTVHVVVDTFVFIGYGYTPSKRRTGRDASLGPSVRSFVSYMETWT